MRGRRPTCLWLLLILSLAWPGTAFSRDLPSLGIDLTGEKGIPVPPTVESSLIDDPHRLPCDDCHLDPPAGKKAGALRGGDDPSALCTECHPNANLHPVGIPLAEPGAEAAKVDLPLGRGPNEGKITCLTCHYLHGKEFRRNLLHGDTVPEKSRRDTLCSQCHSGSLKQKSPHGEGGGACHLCHMSPPKEGVAQNLDPNLQTVCNFCHNALENRHYFSVNPLLDEAIRADTRNLGMPLLAGKFTCVSCHDPHAASGRKKLLRDIYLGLAAYSKSIDPHWKDVMCVACHEGEPAKGEPKLSYRGDLNFICNRCHAGRYSRHDIHPVNVIPSAYVTIPDDMPLKENRVTCETCHDSSLQEGGERRNSLGRGNPKFLRGSFYNRREFCLKCHLQEHFRTLNPHLQIDDRGAVKEMSCVFCHSSIPDAGRQGIESVTFDETSLNDLCLMCHERRYVESHPEAPHMVKPSREVLDAIQASKRETGIEFPLADGAIVCVTCHNPHQEGVIQGEPIGVKRLRSSAGREMCASCHAGK